MGGMIKNIMYVIAAFCALALVSCEEVYTEGDELLYQISQADSTRCMEEILKEIRITAKENQYEEDNYMKSLGISFPICMPRPSFTVDISRKKFIQIHLLGWTPEIADTANLTVAIVDYFMINRNLTEAETGSVASNPNDKGFNAVLYMQFTMAEVEEQLERAENEHQELSAIPEADSGLVNYFQSKVDDWQEKKSVLDFLQSDVLKEAAAYHKVEVIYHHPSKTSERVLNDAAMAFYHLRNIECLRYFGETYLSLYDRFQRKKQPFDKEKLEVLDVVRPIALFDKNLAVSPPLPEPVLIQPPSR